MPKLTGMVKEAGIEILGQYDETTYEIRYLCCGDVGEMCHQSVLNKIRKLEQDKIKPLCRKCARAAADARYRRRLKAHREALKEEARMAQMMTMAPPPSVAAAIKKRRGGFRR